MKAVHPHKGQRVFPRTRYQGSKRKLAHAIVEQVRGLEFTTVLDAFGGTGAVAYAFKRAGKEVTYNDLLAFNHQIGLALIENDSVRLDEEGIAAIGRARPGVEYDDFIERTFEGIYFTTAENRWLDLAVADIRGLTCTFRQAIGMPCSSRPWPSARTTCFTAATCTCAWPR